ncbi:MAG: hypothetical protein ACLSUW_01740 [Akkermansia sp.]
MSRPPWVRMCSWTGRPAATSPRLSLARCRELGLDKPVYVAELDPRKMQRALPHLSRLAELPDSPDPRDAAMELPLSTPNADIVKAIEAARENCSSATPALTYLRTPQKLPSDRKSIAYTSVPGPAKTLTAAEVDAAHQRVLKP